MTNHETWRKGDALYLVRRISVLGEAAQHTLTKELIKSRERCLPNRDCGLIRRDGRTAV
jgi:hypothetical protein